MGARSPSLPAPKIRTMRFRGRLSRSRSACAPPHSVGVRLSRRARFEDGFAMDPKNLATLSEALCSEYKARAIYRVACQRFGDVEPFVHLAETSERQVDALRQFLQRRQIEPPEDRSMGRIELPPTSEQACLEAIAAETETADTCERLLDEVDEPVARMILSQLEEASRYQRLPLLHHSLERRKA